MFLWQTNKTCPFFSLSYDKILFFFFQLLIKISDFNSTTDWENSWFNCVIIWWKLQSFGKICSFLFSDQLKKITIGFSDLWENSRYFALSLKERKKNTIFTVIYSQINFAKFCKRKNKMWVSTKIINFFRRITWLWMNLWWREREKIAHSTLHYVGFSYFKTDSDNLPSYFSDSSSQRTHKCLLIWHFCIWGRETDENICRNMIYLC